MKYDFVDMCERVRELMNGEFVNDVSLGTYCKSVSLKNNLRSVYEENMVKAIQEGDEETLAAEILTKQLFNVRYVDKNGKERKTSSDAHLKYARTEFNKYYIRAVCLRSIELGKTQVEIYRARESSWKRPESEQKIKNRIDAEALLADIRANTQKAPTLLPEVNSGLSVKII